MLASKNVNLGIVRILIEDGAKVNKKEVNSCKINIIKN